MRLIEQSRDFLGDFSLRKCAEKIIEDGWKQHLSQEDVKNLLEVYRQQVIFWGYGPKDVYGNLEALGKALGVSSTKIFGQFNLSGVEAAAQEDLSNGELYCR